MSEFAIKDSGARQEFEGGMVRDTTEGKINFLSIRFGPMFRRWADHLTKGRKKYPDASPGTPNWTLAQGMAEYLRAKESAARHFESWLAGERDEDHAAGVFFNIDLAEYVLENSKGQIDPAAGARVVSPTSVEIGDSVRVTSDDSFNGQFGVITERDGTAYDFIVELDNSVLGPLGFNENELERVGG